MFVQIFKTIASKLQEKFCDKKLLEFGTCLEKTGSVQGEGETILNPLPDDKILDWSKLTQIADNILKYI